MMRSARQLQLLFILLAVSATASEAIEKPEPQPVVGKIEWVMDYDEGKKLSATTGKPMFVVFRCER